MSRRFVLITATALVAGLVLPVTGTAAAKGGSHHRPHLAWQLTDTGTDEQFRGLDAVNRRVAWLGGNAGSVLRTVDGGRTWEDVSPTGLPEGQQFRDVEAFGRLRAVVLGIGNGELSRIYRTGDGGQTWDLTFLNDDPAAFYDCMTWFDHRRGLALSDPVDGKFRILATKDGGRSWKVRSTEGMPDAIEGEFAFAASGTCITSYGPKDAWFGTGGGTEARVFHSRDGGHSWTVSTTGMLSNPSAGVFSLAFRNRWKGFAIGGDFAVPDAAVDALATTRDGGRSWKLVDADRAPTGYRSGSAWLSRALGIALAVGPTGSDVSFNGGRSWHQFDDGSFDSVECARFAACWASGAGGRVARLTLHR